MRTSEVHDVFRLTTDHRLLITVRTPSPLCLQNRHCETVKLWTAPKPLLTNRIGLGRNAVHRNTETVEFSARS